MNIEIIESYIENGMFSISMIEDISYEDLSNLVKHSKLIDEYLNKLLPKNSYSIDEISSDVLINYALLKGKLSNIDIKLDDKSVSSSEKMFFRELDNIPRLSSEDTLKYLKIYHELKSNHGDEEKMAYYRNLVVMGNIRLIIYIAHRYVNLGLDYLELIQEGVFGMMNAVDKFDASYNLTFGTYAFISVKRSIKKAVENKSSLIRKPGYYMRTLNSVKEKESYLSNVLGRKPTLMEIAQELGWSLERLETILIYDKDIISLEKPIDENEDAILKDLVEDENGVNPEEFVMENFNIRLVEQLIEVLNPQEKKVIELRFGLFDGKCYTLEEIGKKFSLTRERIRQIEMKALKKMKTYANGKSDIKSLYEKKQSEEIRNDLGFEGKFLKDILDIDDNELMSLQEKHNELLISMFGYYLNERANFSKIDISKNIMFYKFVSKFKNEKCLLKCPLRGYTLTHLTNVNQLYLLKYFDELDIKSKKRSLLVKYFGFNLDCVFIENRFVQSEVSELMKIIQDIINSYKKYIAYLSKLWDGKKLSEIVKSDNDKVFDIFEKLNKNSNNAKILAKVFGTYLENRCNFENLSYQDIADLDEALKYYRQALFVKNKRENINNNDIINSFRRILNYTANINEYFKEAIRILPDNVRIILELKMGVYNNRIYSLEEIAKLFGITLQEASITLDQGMILLDQILDVYSEKYKTTEIPSKGILLSRIR